MRFRALEQVASQQTRRERALRAGVLRSGVAIITGFYGSSGDAIATIIASQGQFLSTGAVAADAARHSVGTRDLRGGVAVITGLILAEILDAVATGLIGTTVSAASIARGCVPVVADLSLLRVDGAVAAQHGAPVRQPASGGPASGGPASGGPPSGTPASGVGSSVPGIPPSRRPAG